MLELSHRSVTYTGVLALDDVTLRIADGERVALVGPNGAGKSTLLRELAALRTAEGNPLGVLVPQETPAGIGLTARAFVMLGRTARLSPWRGASAEDEAAVERALAAVGVAHLADRRLDAVSGGERRRLAIALALASEAQALLLDEPEAQLDFMRRAEFRRLLVSLKCTIVASVHDLPQDDTCFTRAILLAHGRIVADGRPAVALAVDNLRRAWEMSAS